MPTPDFGVKLSDLPQPRGRRLPRALKGKPAGIGDQFCVFRISGQDQAVYLSDGEGWQQVRLKPDHGLDAPLYDRTHGYFFPFGVKSYKLHRLAKSARRRAGGCSLLLASIAAMPMFLTTPLRRWLGFVVGIVLCFSMCRCGLRSSALLRRCYSPRPVDPPRSTRAPTKQVTMPIDRPRWFPRNQTTREDLSAGGRRTGGGLVEVAC